MSKSRYVDFRAVKQAVTIVLREGCDTSKSVARLPREYIVRSLLDRALARYGICRDGVSSDSAPSESVALRSGSVRLGLRPTTSTTDPGDDTRAGGRCHTELW